MKLNFKQLIYKYRIIFIVGFVVFGLILSMIFTDDQLSKSGSSGFYKVTEKNTNENTFNAAQSSNVNSKGKTYPLKINKVTPKPQTYSSLFENVSFRVYFSENIDINSLKVSITPNKDLDIYYADGIKSEVYIKPKTKWGLNTRYKVTINNAIALKNSDNKLVEPYSFEFNFIYVAPSKNPAVD